MSAYKKSEGNLLIASYSAKGLPGKVKIGSEDYFNKERVKFASPFSRSLLPAYWCGEAGRSRKEGFMNDMGRCVASFCTSLIPHSCSQSSQLSLTGGRHKESMCRESDARILP